MTKPPIVLAFDTSQGACAACLLGAGPDPLVQVDVMARGQAEHLMGMLEMLLARAGLGWQDIDLIGVGIGPGNFTGIRISVAAARGLAMSLGVPAIGVSAFDAIPPRDFPYWVSIRAPRDQAYIQRIDHSDTPPQTPPKTPPELTPGLPPELVPPARLANLDAPLVDALAIAPEQRIVALANRALAGRTATTSATTTTNKRPAPLYVRAADAAPARDVAPVILP